MKILVIAPTPYFADRGCHVRIYEEARALAGRGHELRIVTYHLGRNPGGVPVERIPAIPWYRKLAAGPSWHKPYLDLLLLFKSWQVGRRFRPDLIHAHLHEGAFVGAFLKRLLRVPLLFDCQGSLAGELLDHGFMRRHGLLHRLFVRLERWIVRRADAIVTSSSPMAETIRRDFPEISERVLALPDAVDVEIFRPLGQDTALRHSLRLPVGKKLLVYLGAMTDYQGIGLLLDAFADLAARRDNFHALLMGYPEALYVRRADQLGLAGRVTFTGRVDYAVAASYLALGDFAVSPKLSATEANGKLLNYIACGLPCVVFDTVVNRELLGNVGIYAAFGDAADFAHRLAELLDDPDRLTELSRQSREHAIHNHSWAARIAMLEGVYGGMLR